MKRSTVLKFRMAALLSMAGVLAATSPGQARAAEGGGGGGCSVCSNEGCPVAWRRVFLCGEHCNGMANAGTCSTATCLDSQMTVWGCW